MLIVDTHCHAGLLKYEPVESLLYHMETSGVSQAVLIQYGGNSDNSYLADCLRRCPGRFAAAMIVDPDDDGTAMRRWAEAGLTGIRLGVESRARGPDPLAHWRTADELGLVVSAVSTPDQMRSPAFREVLDSFPELSICIEHLASVGRADTDAEYRKGLAEIAHRPNLSMKLPGFGEFCTGPMPWDPIPPVARLALEAFGPERLMWGSDFPPVSGREGYHNSLRVPLDYFGDLGDSDREWIFGGAARAVWDLPPLPR